MRLPERILVLAPHPDDEILMAAGLIRRGVMQEGDMTVCVVTNGDYLCPDQTKGVRRLRESMEALSLLGVEEKNIHFLGYPDTGFEPEVSFLTGLLAEMDEKRVHASSCGRETYGLEGKKPDFRFALEGRHSPYCKAAFEEDLKDMIAMANPDLILTSSPWDQHGDHAGLYTFVRNRLLTMPKRPVLWSSLIHSPSGDDCWPSTDPSYENFTCPPGMNRSLWEQRISVPLPVEMMGGVPEEHVKYRAILTHRTALNFTEEPEVVNYLLSFAKGEEIFWKTDFSSAENSLSK